MRCYPALLNRENQIYRIDLNKNKQTQNIKRVRTEIQTSTLLGINYQRG